MAGDWKHGLFGCLDNCGICIITYLIPCLQFGQNAQAVGDNCLLCGVAFGVPVLGLIAGMTIRGKIREQKGISGSPVGDLLVYLLCPLCAVAQEAQELQDAPKQSSSKQTSKQSSKQPKAKSMARE